MNDDSPKILLYFLEYVILILQTNEENARLKVLLAVILMLRGILIAAREYLLLFREYFTPARGHFTLAHRYQTPLILITRSSSFL